MVVCPQCNIEYEDGKEFCKQCGKFLLVVEEPHPEEDPKKIKLVCPKCQLPYKKGTYCRKCGSLLMKQLLSQAPIVQPLEKKLAKKWSKEWNKLVKEEKELESCINNLETQKETVSEEVIHPLYLRYRDRLNSLSPLMQDVENELGSINKRVSKEIDSLEEELKPIQKRLEEFQALHKHGAIIKSDFQKEKKKLKKEIKAREKDLRKYSDILYQVPSKIRGNTVVPRFTWSLIRSLPWIAAGIIVIPMVAGGVSLLQRNSSEKSSSYHLSAALEDQEAEKILSVFDAIKEANLHKDIRLFMSCYADDFKDREVKQQDTLKTWEQFDYIDLSYEIKEQVISSEESAHALLEWKIVLLNKTDKKQETIQSTMDVNLKKKDGLWKIEKINTVG